MATDIYQEKYNINGFDINIIIFSQDCLSNKKKMNGWKCNRMTQW
jgi:hypothetical protein